MRRWGIACVFLIVFLAGCAPVAGESSLAPADQLAGEIAGNASDERARMFGVYDQIDMDATFADLVADFGEGQRINVRISEHYYLWVSGGAGAYVSFYDDDHIQSKTLYFKRHRELSRFTQDFDRALVDSLRVGDTYAQVALLLGGDGVETARSRLVGEDPGAYHRQIIWCNQDESYLQCVFDQNDILQTFHAVGF